MPASKTRGRRSIVGAEYRNEGKTEDLPFWELRDSPHPGHSGKVSGKEFELLTLRAVTKGSYGFKQGEGHHQIIVCVVLPCSS